MSDAPHFDPDLTWRPLEEAAARETDPRRKQLLLKVCEHMRTEFGGDLDGLMATLCDEPAYHFWGMEMAGPKGREAVHAFYSGMIGGGGNRFHFDIKRIVVDDDSVVTEGTMRQLMAGAAVAASGITEVNGEPLDAEASYLSESQILTVWPATPEGELIGEDIYFGSSLMAKLTKMPETLTSCRFSPLA